MCGAGLRRWGDAGGTGRRRGFQVGGARLLGQRPRLLAARVGGP
jgi:hypothetical protein